MRINPVLNKELRLRMRGWKATITLTVYLAVLALVAIFIIINAFGSPYESVMDRENTMMAYTVLSMFQFFLIAFIAPALTSGSISGERERQTLDLLLCTEMAPHSIILGKLFASLSQVILLIVASLPVLSIVYLFGGISTFELLQTFFFYIVFAVTLGSIGLFFSTHIKKTTTSNVVTYAVILFLMFGTIFVTVLYYSFINISPSKIDIPLLIYFNPFASFGALLADQFGMYKNMIMSFGNASPKLPLWQVNIIINIVMSAILIVLSAYRLNPVRGKVSITKKREQRTENKE